MLKPGTIVALAKGIANREDHGGGFKGAVKGVVKGVTGNDQIDFLREIAKNTSNMKDMSSDSKPGAAGQLPVPEVEQSRKVNKKTLKCNKPRRTPGHKTKSHIVKACSAAKKKFDVWPSAYASGWGVRCTRAGGPGKMGKSKKKK